MDPISDISVPNKPLKITLNHTLIFECRKLWQNFQHGMQKVLNSKTKRTLVFCNVLFVVLIFPLSAIIMENYRQQLESWWFTPDRIDWHDWDLIDQDELRDGIGEHGIAAHLPEYPESSKYMNDTYGYNGYLSEKIALDRALPDLRPEQ